MGCNRKIALGFFCLASFLAITAWAQRLTATWQGQELATVLERVASTVDQPMWLDRRVDPQQQVTAQFNDMPYDQALEKLATQHNLGVAQLNGVVYVGPEKTARGLTTLLSQTRAAIAKLPAAHRKAWLQSATWSWPRLSEPRALLADLVRQANGELVDDELVPHDLWRAGRLPSMALVDRVVLLLAGFDLTCDISADGKSCRVVRIEYPLPVAGEEQPPKRTVSPQGAPTTDTRQQFSLRLQNQPVGRVLDQLGSQLQLEIKWDEASLRAKRLSRETLVSCDVAKVDLDGLLRGILEPAGMTFTRDGQRVEIHAGP